MHFIAGLLLYFYLFGCVVSLLMYFVTHCPACIEMSSVTFWTLFWPVMHLVIKPELKLQECCCCGAYMPTDLTEALANVSYYGE